MTATLPVSYPFVADYVDQFPVGGGGHVTARQRVRVLKRFGMNYRIEAIAETRIPDIPRALRPGETILVKCGHIRPMDAKEIE